MDYKVNHKSAPKNINEILDKLTSAKTLLADGVIADSSEAKLILVQADCSTSPYSLNYDEFLHLTNYFKTIFPKENFSITPLFGTCQTKDRSTTYGASTASSLFTFEKHYPDNAQALFASAKALAPPSEETDSFDIALCSGGVSYSSMSSVTYLVKANLNGDQQAETISYQGKIVVLTAPNKDGGQSLTCASSHDNDLQFAADSTIYVGSTTVGEVFSNTSSLQGHAQAIQEIRVADVNEDGKMDILVQETDGDITIFTQK